MCLKAKNQRGTTGHNEKTYCDMDKKLKNLKKQTDV